MSYAIHRLSQSQRVINLLPDQTVIHNHPPRVNSRPEGPHRAQLSTDGSNWKPVKGNLPSVNFRGPRGADRVNSGWVRVIIITTITTTNSVAGAVWVGEGVRGWVGDQKNSVPETSHDTQGREKRRPLT